MLQSSFQSAEVARQKKRWDYADEQIDKQPDTTAIDRETLSESGKQSNKEEKWQQYLEVDFTANRKTSGKKLTDRQAYIRIRRQTRRYLHCATVSLSIRGRCYI